MDSNSLLAQVWEGLSRPYGQKYIPSAYFYDDRGSQIYVQIENLQEYYPIRIEKSILSDPYTVKRMQQLLSNPSHLTLVDLGAGDGHKSLVFLEQWCLQAEAAGIFSSIKYIPIDVSAEACRQVAELFENSKWKQNTKSTVTCQPVVGDSLAELATLRKQQSEPICVFFLGSSLGNHEFNEGIKWLRQLRSCLLPGDFLFLGLDLVKSHHILIPAYSDPGGVVAEFNLNLVRRLNKDFAIPCDPNDFEHYAFYNPRIQAMESYLVSRKEQTFKTIHLAAHEMIHTEVSMKYRLEDIRIIAESTGFKWITDFLDAEKLFVDTVWKV